MTIPSAGVVLPSQRAATGETRDLGRVLVDTAEAAADSGFDTAWVWDHLLVPPAFYTGAWHAPFVALASVAQTGLRLGTGILVAPLRPPVQTATEIATLQHLSGQPLRLGVGTGWNPKEFEASGVLRSDRGARTDELLDVVDDLFDGRHDFDGRFLTYRDVDPGVLGDPPEVWIAGGSQVAQPGSVEAPKMAKAVAERILRYGRWLIRPSASADDYRRDLEALDRVAQELDRPGAQQIEAAHINVLHIVETDDPEEARRAQIPAFYSLMSDARDPAYFDACYMLGSLDEIRSAIAAWDDSGLSHLGLYFLGDPVEQIRLCKKHFGDLLGLHD